MNPSAPVMKAVLFIRLFDQSSSYSGAGSRNSAGFDPEQRSVPKPYEGPLDAWQEQLSTLGPTPAKKGLNPRVLPGQAWGIQLPSHLLRGLMHLFSDVQPQRIEIDEVVLEVLETSCADLIAVLQRSQV